MSRLLKAPLLLLALVCVGLIRLLARFGILIRFGEFWSERIGHLAGNTECYLCERDGGRQPKSFDIWFHRAEPACKQIAKMYGRVMNVDRTGFSRIVSLTNSCFSGCERHVAGSAQLDRDIFNHYATQLCHISFTEEEEALGRRKLKEWGIPEGAKWVCLIVRDSAYLPGLKYHNYRDTDVDDYALAAHELVKLGYYVFRMGAKVNKPWGVGGDMIHDYATNGTREDFMDAYLGANCEFCISTGTGFDAIPAVFRRPIVFVNYCPLEYLNTWVHSLAIWKHHYRDGKLMTTKEIYESGAGQFMKTEEFLEAGITLKDNTPEEIRDVVMEMALGRSTEPQDQFWSEFPRSMSPYNKRPLHPEQIRLRVGQKFLESYEQR